MNAATVSANSANTNKKRALLLFFCIAVFAMAVMFAGAAFAQRAEGLVTVRVAVLFDAPSAQAKKKLILSGGYPLRQISAVSGWRKVLLSSGESGWVRADAVRKGRAALALADGAIVKTDPSDSAPGAFYAKAGVVLEVLGKARAGWWQVLHSEGEAGYAAAREVWVNF